jgi:hypothetical protein
MLIFNMRTHLYYKFALRHNMHLNKTFTIAILAVTVVIAASMFMSTRITQAVSIEQGIQLLNQSAGRLEQTNQTEAGAQLRALAANLTDIGEICPQCSG